MLKFWPVKRYNYFSLLVSRFCHSDSKVTDTAVRESSKMEVGSDGEDLMTHFGFRLVSEDEKLKRVHEVFKSVASNYDLMNDAMSLGIHRLWKDKFISVLNPFPEMSLLDVAGGTGDIAFRFLKYVDYQNNEHQLQDVCDLNFDEDSSDEDSAAVPNEPRVIVCDINQSMLDVGANRAKELGLSNRISWLCGDAEKLPVESNSFDAYTIAFGIRNVVHIDKALSEAYRILKPGGRFLCLEFSQVTSWPFNKLYDSYSFQVIPVLGQILARDWHSYQYLVESIRKFPNQEDFKTMIKHAGFQMVNYENMSSGIVAIHSGFKL